MTSCVLKKSVLVPVDLHKYWDDKQHVNEIILPFCNVKLSADSLRRAFKDSALLKHTDCITKLQFTTYTVTVILIYYIHNLCITGTLENLNRPMLNIVLSIQPQKAISQ